MDAKDHNDCLLTLQTLIAKEKGVHKLLSLAMKVKCQIEMSDYDDATITCAEMASLLDQIITFQNQPENVIDQLLDEIELLTKCFINIKVETALLLQQCRFSTTKFFKGGRRLVKLSDTGGMMQYVAAEMKKQKKAKEFREQYSFMDLILREMQQIDNVDGKSKTRIIVCFLKYYGFCCNEVMDYGKSIEIHKQAILLMETTYGRDESHDFFMLGLCHTNLGATYESLNKLEEAKQCYEAALKIYNQAKDWNSDSKKLNSISFTLGALERLRTKSAFTYRPGSSRNQIDAFMNLFLKR